MFNAIKVLFKNMKLLNNCTVFTIALKKKNKPAIKNSWVSIYMVSVVLNP